MEVQTHFLDRPTAYYVAEALHIPKTGHLVAALVHSVLGLNRATNAFAALDTLTQTSLKRTKLQLSI